LAAGGTRLAERLTGRALRRAVISIVVCLVVWEVGARCHQWFGFKPPWLGDLPAPTAVLASWWFVVHNAGYWRGWVVSSARVLGGFSVALALGIPLGLTMAVSRVFRGVVFPVFEVLRPIPPLAWVPASIIFWPTQELAIGFITFLGAFFVIVINVLGGARAIDIRYIQAARSMGASDFYIFRKIILPGTLPSITVGAAVGIGITWEVVVAAEMISGGSRLSGGGAGLGHFIWSSYLGGAYEQIVVGMISIGIAGYICSAIVRRLGDMATPWLRLR
jgi:NitT/TauT family transport system permease protein